jgi:adenylate kinase
MDHPAQLYVITGSSGIGKTTLVSFLKEQSLKQIAVHDFDEQLVNLKEQLLANEQISEKLSHDTIVDSWIKETTAYWVHLAAKNVLLDTSTVVLGLIHPKEVIEVQSDIPIAFCLLDASDERIKERLMGKRFSTPEKREGLRKATGKTPEDFIKENKMLMEQLRQETTSVNGTIIDTTHDTLHQTGRKLLAWLRNNGDNDTN